MITIDDVNIGRILTCDEFSCAIIALGVILTTKNNEKNLLLCVYFQKWVGISKTLMMLISNFYLVKDQELPQKYNIICINVKILLEEIR